MMRLWIGTEIGEYHLTLAFLGRCDNAEAAIKAVAEVAAKHAAFSSAASVPGMFGPAGDVPVMILDDQTKAAAINADLVAALGLVPQFSFCGHISYAPPMVAHIDHLTVFQSLGGGAFRALFTTYLRG